MARFIMTYRIGGYIHDTSQTSVTAHIPTIQVSVTACTPTVTILGPHPNFRHLFCVLGYSFPTRSLTRRSDRHQIT